MTIRGKIQLVPQERVRQRLHEGGLLVVGGAAVAAFDVLVVEHVVTRIAFIFATILRAWPGWTRSSRVEVVKRVRGYFTPSLRL